MDKSLSLCIIKLHFQISSKIKLFNLQNKNRNYKQMNNKITRTPQANTKNNHKLLLNTMPIPMQVSISLRYYSRKLNRMNKLGKVNKMDKMKRKMKINKNSSSKMKMIKTNKTNRIFCKNFAQRFKCKMKTTDSFHYLNKK